jgi:antitoxin YefM
MATSVVTDSVGDISGQHAFDCTKTLLLHCDNPDIEKDYFICRHMYNILYVNYLGIPSMDAITYTSARQNLAKTMDRVCLDHEPIIITRSNDQSVVMMSLDDYNAMEETAYLLRNPKNAKRLLESIAQLEKGSAQERELLD